MAKGEGPSAANVRIQFNQTKFLSQMKEVHQSFTRLATVAVAPNKALGKLGKELKSLSDKAKSAAQAICTAGTTIETLAKAAAQTTGKVQKLAKEAVGSLAAEARKMGTAVRNAAERGLGKLNEIAARSGAALSGAKRAIGKVKDAAGEAESAVGGGGLSSVLGGVAGVAVKVGAKLGSAAVDGFGKMIDLASEAETTNRHMEASFGGSTAEVAANVDALATSLGKSTIGFRGLAADAGMSLGNLGLGSEAAGEMSVNLLDMAADLSAVKNVGMSEAMNMLTDAVQGGGSGLKQFGIELDDAAVKQKALQMGLAASEQEVSKQDEAHARMAMLMEQTAQFAGGAEAALDTYTGQMDRLKAVVSDAGAEFGTIFLPLITRLVGYITDQVVPLIEEWKNKWTEIAPQVGEKIAEVVVTVEGAITTAWSYISFLVGAISDGFAAMWAIIQPILNFFFGDLSEGAQKATDIASFAFKNWRLMVETTFLEAALAVVKFVNDVIYFFTDTLPTAIEWFANNWKDVFSNLWEFVKTFFSNLFKNIGTIAANLPALLSGKMNWSDAWTGLTDGFKAEFKELPKFAERQASLAEQTIGGNLDSNRQKIDEEWAKFSHDQENKRNKIRDTVKNTLDPKNPKALGDGKAVTPPTPETLPAVTTPPVKEKSDDPVVAGDRPKEPEKVAASFVGFADLWKNIAKQTYGTTKTDPAAATAKNTGKAAADTSKVAANTDESVRVLLEIRDILKTLNVGLAE